jgi:hypothetical protein
MLADLIIEVCAAAGAGRMHNRERWIDSEARLREELFDDISTPDGGTTQSLRGGWVRRLSLVPADTMTEANGGEFRNGRRMTYEITLMRDLIDDDDTASEMQDTVDAVADAFESEIVRERFLDLGYVISPLSASAITDANYNMLRAIHRAVCQLTCTGVAG